MKIFHKGIKILFILAICVQSIMCILWVFKCGLSMPDTTENSFYLEAARTLRFDEYTGVIYPVFLRLLYLPFSGALGRGILSVLQLLAIGVATVFFLGIFDKKEISLSTRIGIIIYVLTFPVIIHIAFQTLPEAFAVAVFLVWSRLLMRKERGAKQNVTIVALYIAMGFMSLRYAYIAGIVWAVYLLVIYRKKFFNNIACIITGAVFIIILNLIFVDAGSYGRMPATLSTGLMSNYAFEAFEADYYFWPQNAKEAIPFEEIKPYRAYREHIVTEMGQPFLSNMTYFKADVTALGIAKASIMNRSKETIDRFFDNCSSYLLTPVTFIENTVGEGRSATPRNLYSFSGKDSGWALLYMYISIIMCAVISVFFCLIGLISKAGAKKESDYNSGLFLLVSYVTLAVVYALFAFSYFDYILMSPVIIEGLILLVVGLNKYVQQADTKEN